MITASKRQKFDHDRGCLEIFDLSSSYDLATTEATDVTLRVGVDGEDLVNVRFARFPLAAQSPVFRRMLYGSMAEASPDSIVRVPFPLEAVQAMLNGMCSGKVLMNDELVCDLNQLADFYQIDALKRATLKYIEEHLSVNTATLFMSKSAKLSDVRAKVFNYVQVRTLACLSGSKVEKLSRDSLLEILESDWLTISELQLFHAVLRWGRAQELGTDSATGLRDLLAPLMEHIRFPLIENSDLADTVEPTGIVDSSLLYEAFLGKNKKTTPDGIRFRKREPLILSLECPETSMHNMPEIVNHGLFFHLGTAGGTREYINPCVDGIVTVTWSAACPGHSLQNFVGLQHQACASYTSDCPNSWMQVDLGDSHRFIPKRYAIRDGMTARRPSNNNVLRNWNLEARCKQTEQWVVIRSHTNDNSLTANMVFSWEVSSDVGFRYFRLHQTGLNSSGNRFLLCSGFELWGDYYVEDGLA
mmetsp:Transcript_83299/g.130024  ORF Transcript_83299/g.130024 Transcript_83299/m.130024 type:complete len:472 (+) Transcript_83299:63-1478(+)